MHDPKSLFTMITVKKKTKSLSSFLLPVFKNSSKSRLRNLDSLHAFVSAATKELMWLNDKEEEEVNFDWSDKNNNMTAKKDNYSVCVQSLSVSRCKILPPCPQTVRTHVCVFQGLMRELELREKKVNEIQALGDKLVRDGHPGKKTVEVRASLAPAKQ